jgi:type I restriction-modification system DNA methylase subunit
MTLPTQQKLTKFKGDRLETFNNALRKLKEEFHRTGRFDDANVKLDEIVKLLIIKYFDLKNRTNKLSLRDLRAAAKKKFGGDDQIVKMLQNIFRDIASSKDFINRDGTNIFGSNPQLNIQTVDYNFAEKIIEIINDINWNGESNIDLLNESFGHFVRDNFRNHKEDAQYMTPIEVVDAMINIALVDIKSNLPKNRFVVMDPTCGVGTFLTRAKEKISTVIPKKVVVDFIGQDKVDRMVRMSKINLLFSGLNPYNINQGNSILGESFINEKMGMVDLIITNPPFGAEFKITELIPNLENFEILPQIKNQIQSNTINSELLILDRSLKLLKPGGRLLIIVPDAVVSAGGIYEIYRNYLAKNYFPRAIIDLPSVTFAQAGTRTKCSVVYIEKPKQNIAEKTIFMAVIDDIGYEVKEKIGSPVKIYKGENELFELQKHYLEAKKFKKAKVISENPSTVAYPLDQLMNGKWNANFYKSERIKTIENFKKVASSDIEIRSLEEIAEFISKQRAKKRVSEKVKCISVLHVKEDSSVQLDEVFNYKPTCPGIECKPGEIIFSKINPRIPRAVIVPKTKYELTCSTEFEILTPKDKKFTYLLKTILLSGIAQKQINALTSGTSSSHNRIKESELRIIKIPWPRRGSRIESQLISLAKKIEEKESSRYLANENIKKAKTAIDNLIGI